MVVVSILPQAEFGPNDHREDALHFSNSEFYSSRITETYRRTSEAPTLRRSYYQTQTVPDPIQSQIPYLSTPEIFKNIQKTVPAGIH